METIGQRIIAKAGISDRDGDPLAAEIDAAIESAFQVGFEHAVAGGKEATRKFPQFKDPMPLVLYFAHETDRPEMIDMILEVKRGLIECKIPEET